MKTKETSSTIIENVAEFISLSQKTTLPEAVIEKAKLNILDTVAAMISGSVLKPGRAAIRFGQNQLGPPEATMVGVGIQTSAINAAMVNAFAAHADETDDAHHGSHSHPGCAAIPAALAISEKNDVDGLAFIKAVVTGYDIGCRITKALGVEDLRRHSKSTHSIAGNFCAAAAAASAGGLKAEAIKSVMSYTVQQCSGLMYWARDVDHIEKAFVFGGMPARNGVTSVVMSDLGFTGVEDPFSGKHNFFEGFSTEAYPEELVKGLGEEFEIMRSSLKQFPVGAPIQAPLEALLRIMRDNELKTFDIEEVTARIPDYGLRIVNDRKMSDVNLQYILAVAILDNELTFEAAHSSNRMNDEAVIELKKRINAVADDELSKARIKRQGIVEVKTKDGRYFREHVVNWRGKAENPMNRSEVEHKAEVLLKQVLGASRTSDLISFIKGLDTLPSIREIRPHFSFLDKEKSEKG